MSFMDDFNSAEVEDKNFEPLPKGNYTAVIDDVSIALSSDGDEVEWVFKVVDGDFKNRKLWRKINFQYDWAMGAFKQDVATLSLDSTKCKDLKDFGPILQETIGKKVKIHVTQKPGKTGKVFNNAYINGWFNAAESVGPESPAALSLDESEELPF